MVARRKSTEWVTTDNGRVRPIFMPLFMEFTRYTNWEEQMHVGLMGCIIAQYVMKWITRSQIYEAVSNLLPSIGMIVTI